MLLFGVTHDTMLVLATDSAGILDIISIYARPAR